MATQTSPTSRGFRRPLRHVLGTPMRLQTYRNLLYLVLMFPLGLAYFTVLVNLFAYGVGLSVVLVGIPIIVLTLALSVGLAAFERMLARVLLRIDIPTSSVDAEQTIWSRIKQLVIDRRTWTAVLYLLSEFFVGTVVFVLLSSLLVTAGSLLLTPFYYTRLPTGIYLGPTPIIEFTPKILFGWDTLLIGLKTTIRIDAWHISGLPAALLVAVGGAVLLILSLQLLNSLAWLWGRYMQAMLRTPRYWTGLTR
jgi:hypothetical protein